MNARYLSFLIAAIVLSVIIAAIYVSHMYYGWVGAAIIGICLSIMGIVVIGFHLFANYVERHDNWPFP